MFDFFETSWTVAHQAPLFMGFSRQEYWNGLPIPPPEDLPNLGLKPGSPALAGGFFTAEPPGKPYLLQFLLHTILLCPTFMEEKPRGQGQGGVGGHLEVSRQERYHCSGTVGENGKGGCPVSEEEGPRVRRKGSTGERGPHKPRNPLLCRV